MKHWFAIFTRPKSEKSVADRLERNGFTAYCPVQKATSQWTDRKKTVIVPIFRNYVFVQVEPARQWSVLEVPGVINYVRMEGKPAVIRDTEMDILRQFLKEYADASIVSTALMPDQRVRIVSGIFIDQEAVVQKVDGNKVRIYIDTLGILVQATLEAEALCPVFEVRHKAVG